jgi:glycine/D-amino acid oxidase-like deaminating enzyme
MVISSKPADGVKGLYLAAGGFGLTGRLAADLVANDTPCVDLCPFRLSRLVVVVKIGI